MSLKTAVGYLAVIYLLGLPLFSCSPIEDNSLTTAQGVHDLTTDPTEAYDIAYKAYQYFYPIVENARCLSLSLGYPNSAEHVMYDSFHHNDHALPPNDYVIYSTVWLDLRQEPRILTVPLIQDRYWSVQIIDSYAYNVKILSEQSTYMTRRGGRFMIGGRNYCSKPPSCYRPIDDAYCVNGDTALVIVRLHYYSQKDIDYKVKLIQQHFEVERLSTYCHIDGPYPTLPPVPLYVSKHYYDELHYFEYANYASANISLYRDDEPWFADFAKIGIVPGPYQYPPADMDPTVKQQIKQAILDAITAIDNEIYHPANGVYYEGWQTVLDTPWYGSRTVLKGHYLEHAAGARSGIYGLDKEEAYYAIARKTVLDKYLDARYGQTFYILLKKSDIPPVYGQTPPSFKTYSESPLGYWSITAYDDWTKSFVKGADRYSIGSRDLDTLCRYPDGSIPIILSTEEPKEPAYQKNWLPVPYGAFYLIARLYHPLPVAYKQPYLPPGVQVGLPPYPPTYCPYYSHH